METFSHTTLRAAGVAVLAALVVLGMRAGIDAIGTREGGDDSPIGRALTSATPALTILFCAMPVWIWVPFHARALFPYSRTTVVAGWIVIAVVHLLLFAVTSRFGDRREVSSSLVRTIAGLSLAILLIPAAALQARVFDVDALAEKPNVLLIVLDTVRADRLSSYGYPRLTTPELDAFAQGGVRFSNFYSTSPWTVPSHASMFTGLYPIQHGATQEKLALDNRYATLAEVLSNAGYQTFAASQNPFVSDTVNLAQGFSEFAALWRQWIKPDGTVRDARTERHVVNVAFEDYLATATHDRPFFAFLNYIDAHLPTAPPEPYLSRFLRAGVEVDKALEVGRRRWSRYYTGMEASREDLEILSDLYDAEMAFMSSRLEKLFEALKADGRYEDTLIIVTSDHGEQLGDHDHLGHMFSLYNATVKVPLIVRMPGGAQAGRIDERAGQLVDLYPTILDVADVPFDRAVVQGKNLLDPSENDRREVVFSEYYFPKQALAMYQDEPAEVLDRNLSAFRRRLRAVEVDGKRLIWSSTGNHELYDTAKDPDELHNRYADWPEVAADLMKRLDATVADYGNGEVLATDDHVTPEFDSETEDALRALGYIQ